MLASDLMVVVDSFSFHYVITRLGSRRYCEIFQLSWWGMTSCAVFWGVDTRSQDWRRSICPYFLWTVISMPIITLNDRLSGWKDTRLWGLSLCSYWLIDDERWCEFHTLVTTWWLCRAPVGIFHNPLNLCCQMWFLNWLSWILIAVNWQLVGQVMDESAQYRGKECSVVCF